MIPIFVGRENDTDTEFSVLGALFMFRSIIQNQKGLVIELVLVTVVSSNEQHMSALVSTPSLVPVPKYSYFCFLDAPTSGKKAGHLTVFSYVTHLIFCK